MDVLSLGPVSYSNVHNDASVSNYRRVAILNKFYKCFSLLYITLYLIILSKN